MINVGVLGGGQLAAMLVTAGVPIGVRVRCIEEAAGTCASLVTPVVVGDLGDAGVLNRWVADQRIDVLTYESEFIDAAIVSGVRGCAVRPSAAGLAASQERLREKRLLSDLGIPVPRYAAADDAGELRAAVGRIGMPCVVKARAGGYDGKGQVVVREPQDVAEAARLADAGPVLVEQHIRFDRELSVLAVRGLDGDVRVYPVVENHHRSGILHSTRAPAPGLDPRMEQQAHAHITALLEHLDYVGVLALELFAVGDVVLANEFAPRVHNSGHWTIEGAVTSQFENHLRAITGLPLGSTAARSHSGLVNLVGGVPDARAILSIGGAGLHLYGKESRPGRKLGHVTVTAADAPARDAMMRQVESVVANVLAVPAGPPAS